MIVNLLVGLFVGWILSLFGFDGFVIKSFAEVGVTVTVSIYYIVFAALGIIGLRGGNN